MRAVALGMNMPLLSAIGNDYGFDNIFSRELEGLAHRGDVLVAFSTSGNSSNILAAVECAKRIGVGTIGFSGEKGELNTRADVALSVPSQNVAHIQETHLFLVHLLSQMLKDWWHEHTSSS
ncbi:MAG: D-sedoheptulose 7-phosphate isomerase [Parcubacteria group bacterium Gr01-1014_66]|nr:MAG: D-sedoheptulose 7-phosphate isomerase [Parcubacteria group bacterium Gr01-1014_66]